MMSRRLSRSVLTTTGIQGECDSLSKGSQDETETDGLDESGDGLDGGVLERPSLSKHRADDAWDRGGSKDDQSEVGGSLVRDGSGQLQESRETVGLESG